ncbi:MAG: polysaccharide deacetylase family protein [bacterium]|jgi:peptidoglycan/xylan/chitin deacetylase (PgdA/CDA1 family)|nr:polysaccharide deacetylase family protein [candidate division KSB1 bacterium]MDH7560450.1 polysaccharide deacetylase family protein [bacterium]
MLNESEEYCKNHPDRLAKRHCFVCGAPICAECKRLAFHHVFCSTACIGRFLLARGARVLSRGLSRLPGLRRRPSFQSLFNLLMAVALVISALTLLRVLRTTQRMEQRLTGVGLPLGVPGPDTSALRVSGPGAMVSSSTFDIVGEAGPNQILSLWADGNLLAVTMAPEGTFRFAGVQARRGQNRFVVRATSADGSVQVLQTIEFFYGLPTVNYLARSFDRGPTDTRLVALTFDGGSSDNAAAEVLEALRSKGVHCTMFLTGAFIRRYPDLVRLMVADGHEIGNHTWSHPHLTTYAENGRHLTRPGVTRELLQRELLATEELFRKVTGKEMAKLWRAPYGEHNAEIRAWAAELGYRQVGWTMGRNGKETMDTLDWVADKNSPAYHSAEEVVERIANFGRAEPQGAAGAIILMHLGTERKDDQVHKMVPLIIDGLRERSYVFVTVSRMM